MKVQLSGHYGYKRIIKAVIPSIIMMIFTSIYSIVDGFFVSNFAGKTAFSAINIIFPVLMIIGALGFLFGAGGSALVSKTLGEGKKELANRYFSMLIYVTIIVGLVLSTILFIFIRPISSLVGADENMLPHCVTYARILLITMTPFMIQNTFQAFFMTAEKPVLGTIFTIASGLTNIILDTLLVGVFKFGLVGAAIATDIAQLVGCFGPLIYFSSKRNTSTLKLVKTNIELRVVLTTCANGASELVTNISSALVNVLYNLQLMKYAGEDGVASYGVIMYVTFIFAAVFIGYNIGTAPIVGYNYGAKNTDELKSLLKKSLVILTICGITLTGLSEILAYPLAKIFVSYDENLLNMTYHAIQIFMFSYLICGYNFFSSSFFTALNDGLISAILSFGRTLVFQIISIFLLPIYFKLDGIWAAIILAESLSLILTIIMLLANKKKYQYWLKLAFDSCL